MCCLTKNYKHAFKAQYFEIFKNFQNFFEIHYKGGISAYYKKYIIMKNTNKK